MGHHRRGRLAALPGSMAVALILLLAACSSGQREIRDLLLGPGDFTPLAVVETSFQVAETTDGQPAGQVTLSGPGFELLQSLVMFETNGEARAVLAGIKEDQAAQGTSPTASGRFQDVSGVLNEARGGEATSTLFFVQGRALVRVSLSGPNRQQLLLDYAEKARSKASRQ